ncbi:hypothetical protein UPYG_G00226870 [Umbra pygmaea]|uniref:Uncharacterized protein n=1 Tax=Umbra pygmaea TaxID=75934 RepID=A0ABD0WHM7_UMBPY
MDCYNHPETSLSSLCTECSGDTEEDTISGKDQAGGNGVDKRNGLKVTPFRVFVPLRWPCSAGLSEPGLLLA